MSDALISFYEYLSVVKALNTQSIKSYIKDIKQLEEYYQPRDLLSLDNMDILKFLAQFENKRTLNRKLSSINNFFNFAKRESLTKSKISLKTSKVPRNLPKYLSTDEILSGLELIDKTKTNGLRDYALILFLYASGCRVSEALNVQREDIIDNWLKIRFAKGEKERLVPLAPIAIKALEEYLKEADISSTYIWLNKNGNRLSRITAYNITKKYLNVSPHTLRHSFASALIIGGADLKVVQELLGHSSLVTTQIYTHIESQELKETINKYHPLAEEI